MLLQRGILPSLGHDKTATEADILGAFQILRAYNESHPDTPRKFHITHIFNVCNFHHRDMGLVCVLLHIHTRSKQSYSFNAYTFM